MKIPVLFGKNGMFFGDIKANGYSLDLEIKGMEYF